MTRHRSRGRRLLAMFVLVGVAWFAIGSALGDFFEIGIDARFIRVTNDGGANRLLHIGEIEAFAPNVAVTGGLDNANDLALAVNGASYESSVGTGGHGLDTAVYNGILDTSSATWTRGAVNAEYVLDLGQTRSLSNVRVWQRVDGCCQERLSGFTVSLLADDGAGNPGAAVASQSWSGNAPLNGFAPFDVSQERLIRPGGPDAIGTETVGLAGTRFIRVRNNGSSRTLHIGEIEAFVVGAPPTVPNGVDNANDVALDSKGASFESSIGTGGHGLATSVYNGVLESGGAVWTRDNAGEYVLDLGQKYNLGTIRVWQRWDTCCNSRLSNFTVSLLDDNGAGAPGVELWSESYPGTAPSQSFAVFSPPPQTNEWFTLKGTDVLQIELDALADTADLLQVGLSGGGELIIEPGATLEVSVLQGRVRDFDTFNILDFGSVSGQFSRVILPDIGMLWDTRNLYVDGTITALPEPATLSLLALGGLAAVLRRRKRS